MMVDVSKQVISEIKKHQAVYYLLENEIKLIAYIGFDNNVHFHYIICST